MKSTVDGFERRYIFTMWTGTNPLTPDRAAEVYSILSNTHCPVVYLTRESLYKWEHPDAPFHPALPYLSATHISDYMRAYLMHHYGGGYTDVKFTYKQWDAAFDALENSDAFAIGYPSANPEAVALSPSYPNREAVLAEYRKDYPAFLTNCAFIFRRDTEFTREWYRRTVEILDSKLDLLRQKPARHPRDFKGTELPDGTISDYPIEYIEIACDAYIPTSAKFKHKLLHFDLAPLHVFHYDLDVPGFREAKADYLTKFLSTWPK
jgi:hypothetical protein